MFVFPVVKNEKNYESGKRKIKRNGVNHDRRWKIYIIHAALPDHASGYAVRERSDGRSSSQNVQTGLEQGATENLHYYTSQFDNSHASYSNFNRYYCKA